MKFKEYDVVRIMKDCEEGVKKAKYTVKQENIKLRNNGEEVLLPWMN